MTTSSRRIQSGFMLIEVLVATTLLAVGVTAALNAIFNSLRATTETRMYTQALFLSQKLMSEFESRIKMDDDYDVPSGGEFDDPPNFRWKASSVRDKEFWTRRIAVTVIWAGNKNELYDDNEENYYRIVTEVPMPRYPEEYKK
jgi:Tfp pilus assembly protein PilV